MAKYKRVISFLLLGVICFVTPLLGVSTKKLSKNASNEISVINLWQVDSFEGGKGSRAQYLTEKAKKLFKNRNIYIQVTSLSADAGRQNISMEILPDIISYGAGCYGFENLINDIDFAYKTWCYGSYCLISLDKTDFNDANESNTVINSGIENKVDVVALLMSIENAQKKAPTAAYVDLINGKYKYLLGTQRDLYRLRTREKSYYFQPINCFNDLYQNVSITTKDKNKYFICKEFIEYIINNCNDLEKIGLVSKNCEVEDEDLKLIRSANFDLKLNGFVSERFDLSIKIAINSKDINMLKNLLK